MRLRHTLQPLPTIRADDIKLVALIDEAEQGRLVLLTMSTALAVPPALINIKVVLLILSTAPAVPPELPVNAHSVN